MRKSCLTMGMCGGLVARLPWGVLPRGPCARAPRIHGSAIAVGRIDDYSYLYGSVAPRLRRAREGLTILSTQNSEARKSEHLKDKYIVTSHNKD